MIRLVSRADALRELPVLAHAVRGMQAAHDPARDYNRETWSGREAEGAAWFAAYGDEARGEMETPAHDGSAAFGLPDPDIETTLHELSNAVAGMMKEMGDETLTFLHVGRDARWPTRRRAPPVLGDSAARFRELGAGKSFDGGIRADGASLAEVLDPLFWTVRMDMGYGDVFFAPDRSPWVGSLCQYGNLHLDAYGAGQAARVATAALRAGLVAVEDCGAPLGGAIPMRRLRGTGKGRGA